MKIHSLCKCPQSELKWVVWLLIYWKSTSSRSYWYVFYWGLKFYFIRKKSVLDKGRPGARYTPIGRSCLKFDPMAEFVRSQLPRIKCRKWPGSLRNSQPHFHFVLKVVYLCKNRALLGCNLTILERSCLSFDTLWWIVGFLCARKWSRKWASSLATCVKVEMKVFTISLEKRLF